MTIDAGILYLIGCGPGAIDLLTFRAAQRIGLADLILIDRLVDREVLQYASPHARILDAGKAPGDGGKQQADINATLSDALRDGKTVARLKSGDPLVFGRAPEEIAEAIAVGAGVEIVPGVTAALAAAAETQNCVTKRAEIHSFSVVTAKTADDAQPDWVSLVKPGSCVAFYMGVAQAERIQAALLAFGTPADLEAQWIENAGQDTCRTVTMKLSDLSKMTRKKQIKNPAILFVRYPLSAARTSEDATQTFTLQPQVVEDC